MAWWSLPKTCRTCAPSPSASGFAAVSAANPDENGLAHFIEHMVFKGTERRSAEAIAREMDSVGGMLDAFTSKEQICFNAKVLDEHLPIAFDVIADLVLRPNFDSEDVTKEQQVILEEIKMDMDNPEYLLHEVFTRGFWPEHPLGRPILSTPDTVKNFTRQVLKTRFASWFAPDHLVVTAAGNVAHEQVLDSGALANLATSNRWPSPPYRPPHPSSDSPRKKARSRTGTSLRRRSVSSAGSRGSTALPY